MAIRIPERQRFAKLKINIIHYCYLISQDQSVPELFSSSWLYFDTQQPRNDLDFLDLDDAD